MTASTTISSLTMFQTSYEVGDMAVLTFINPFESSLLLVRWGNDLLDLTTSKLVPGSLGLSNVTIPVTESCLGGTSATIVLTAPRGETVKVPALLPLSVLFDPNMPVAIVHTTHLNVPEHPKMLNVAVTIDAAVAAPGGTAGLSVELTDGQGMAVQGEITVFVVNKAALDLTPHPLSSYADVLVGRWHSSHVDTLDSRQRLALEQGWVGSPAYQHSDLLIATMRPWRSLSAVLTRIRGCLTSGSSTRTNTT